METEARHKEYFVEFEKKLREIYPDMLAIGAGCCTKCKVCTYPDAHAGFRNRLSHRWRLTGCW